MPEIKNIDGYTMGDLEIAVQQGGRFVMFQYTVSIVVMTFKRPTDIYFIAPGESAVGKHIGFTLLTLLVGWWGIPWGPIYTIGTLVKNLGGGTDVTREVVQHLRQQNPRVPTSIFEMEPPMK